MQQHVKILAILNIVYGAMTVIAGLVVMLVLGGVAGLIGTTGDQDAQIGAGIMGLIGIIVPIILVLFGAPSIIAGWGLLRYQGWARILTIVLSGLHLLSFPFGTALGIYGLWTLLKPETEAMFRPSNAGWAPSAM